MKESPNLNYIQELSEGNKQFENKIIAIIQRELPEEIKLYKEKLKENNFDAASQSVHKIKHKISILGLQKGYSIAESFEAQLKEKSLKLQGEFNSILEVMLAFIKGK
ncbi:Hpt domain-containing protein [Christiangramia aquimixticola]|uniref:Hpt domain-containing protein n=1 Tax=Christiangramia aquimixticola TaxID=1697558 RepID=UPI003AA86E3A